MTRAFGLVLLTLCLSSPAAFAGKDHDHALTKPVTNPAFDQLKKLVGTWEGKAKMGGKDQTFSAVYELTAGGNVLMEKMFAGTPHEMVTMYYPKGDTVAMTHYCMLGNRPEMTLKKGEPNKMAFEMAGNTGIHSPKEMHMHAMTVSWNGDKQITEEWTSFDNGKKNETATFTLDKKN